MRPPPLLVKTPPPPPPHPLPLPKPSQVALARAAAWTAERHPLIAQDVVLGDGETAAGGDHVTVKFNGWLEDPGRRGCLGPLLDSNIQPPDAALELAVGDPAAIRGLGEGLLDPLRVVVADVGA